jgi:hypothetical protein
VRHRSDYAVDGEGGRFRFGLFDVVDAAGDIVFAGSQLWPTRQGRHGYPTAGFKELTLMMGVTQRRYRKAASHSNRSRRQVVGGTPWTTLRDGAEREGLQVIQFLERHSAEVLKAHHFTEDGAPQENCPWVREAEQGRPATLPAAVVNQALGSVGHAMRRRGLAEELLVEVTQQCRVADYEHSGETVNISMDDVGVKEQQENRINKVVAAPAEGSVRLDSQPPATNQRPTVQNTVAQIERPGPRFTLTGSSVFQVLRFVLAFLLNNSLLTQRLRFFTDGQRSLQGAILAFFGWHPAVSLLLDWFHLVKKFKEELSLACCGREIRNRHLRALLGLLWVGLLDRAQAYLRALPSAELKNTAPIERLIHYLERNRPWIPCYALRRQLGLPNSSNPVERANNLVTSNRQKHKGMSWSEAGSYALTALSAVVLNGSAKTWVWNGVIPVKFAAKAA